MAFERWPGYRRHWCLCPVWETDSKGNKVYFAGRTQEAGLGHHGARYYRPVLRRFIGVDPLSFNVGNPLHSLDRYSYANNNPHRFVDPTGYEPESSVPDGVGPSGTIALAPVVIVGPPKGAGFGTSTGRGGVSPWLASVAVVAVPVEAALIAIGVTTYALYRWLKHLIYSEDDGAVTKRPSRVRSGT